MDTNNWGRDHWSMLAFAEASVVEYRGEIDLNRIRINEKKHPGLRVDVISWRQDFATKYADNKMPDPTHDDIDVLEDLEKYGFLTRENKQVKLSDKGWKVSHLIRRYKGETGKITGFVYSNF